MYFEVEGYKIKGSKKKNILISFELRTKNIEKITLTSFYYHEEKEILVIDYYIGEVRSFSYYLRNIPKKIKKIIENKDIILISEEKQKSNLIVIDQEQDFHYESVNKKHLKF